jgi:fatty acid desaturase
LAGSPIPAGQTAGKGIPILCRDDDSDFLRRQVLTAQNVRGGRLTDLVLGGLNYQIEHHLFPNMPRPSLRRAQPVVRAYCLGHGLPCVETSLIDSYRQALHHLDSVGRGDKPDGQVAPADSCLTASSAHHADQ